MGISANLKKLKATLPAHITLVAVSKTKPAVAIEEAYQSGHRDFGENKAQELSQKSEHLPKDIRWHMIGHLQTNKVKYIAPFVHLIHGGDSLRLLKEINKRGAQNDRTIDCLLQVHIAQEETKFGLSFDECEMLLSSEGFAALQHVRITGLMGMASNTELEEQLHTEFRNLSNFFKKIQSLNSNLSTLSMGMSGDYQIALEEGSTMIRVGSTIFGARVYA